jgi:CheY-like chemotaxis protein
VFLAAQATAGAGRLAFDCPPKLRGVRVLPVDVDEDARHLIKTVLEKYAAQVAAVSTAIVALETLQSTLPDVLISNLGMPEEDGTR